MSRIPLEVIDIATPCPVDWNDMRGDERVRYCKHCSLHVFNLSEMTRRDVEALVSQTEGRLCVRFYRRLDGTVITRDCGWRAAAKRAGRFASAAVGMVLCAVLTPLGLGSAVESLKTIEPRKCEPAVAARMGDVMILGEIARPPAATQPATQPTTAPAIQPAREGS